jgi:ADP-heptose:LPS heptosyltransferase
MEAARLSGLYERIRTARKILVVDLGFLGDTVHLIPALWEIKRHFHGAALNVVTTPVGAEVLGLAPCVDRAWPLVLDPARRTLREQRELVGALRREKFDVAFNTSGADRATILTAMSGARCRIGYPAGRRHFWNQWLIPHWTPLQPKETPAFEQRRQMLMSCGMALLPARWDLQIPEPSARRAEALAPAGAIHFSINASTPLKEWPLEGWVVLARRWLADEADLRIVATGSVGAREQERLGKLASAVANERLTALEPGLAIGDLAAVLRRCRMHIGADSGVLHLAAAAGTPTLALFRDYQDASAWLPSGPGHRALKVPCQCVNRRDPPCAAAGRAECLARLQPAEVETAARALLRDAPLPKAPLPA